MSSDCGSLLLSDNDARHPVQLESPSISYTGALVGVEADRSDLGTDRWGHVFEFLRAVPLLDAASCIAAGSRTCDSMQICRKSVLS